MPQIRRSVAFSGKAKREQLKERKRSKQDFQSTPLILKTILNIEEASEIIEKINFQPTKDAVSKPNRYALQFFKESKEEIALQQEIACQSLEINNDEKSLEIEGRDFFDKDLDFPKRPVWEHGLEKNDLEAQERRYFTEYIETIQEKYDCKELSLFELNLETWRQLWRVLEMSDVILFIIDIRFAALMFPPSLYDYVTKVLKKDIILVINKIDLAPDGLVVAWKHYFEEKYPNLHIVMFTSLPDYNLIGKQSNKSGLQVRKQRGKVHMAAEGAQQILDVCKKIVGNQVDLTSWDNKIKEEMQIEYAENEEIDVGETVHVKKVETDYFQYKKFYNGVLTVGCIGQPNVGKSSLMNALMGKKLVSVSKTPGHTKHFQTIFLTPTVKLCDCPGLVFPSKVNKSIQVLMGSFPVAQFGQPFTTIKYIAERIDLVNLLKIDHPTDDKTWSAMDICDSWAKKKRFYTAKTARLDSYRAANSLLRMTLDGRICLCLRPIGYFKKKDSWELHPDIKIVKWIKARNSDPENYTKENVPVNSDSSDEQFSELVTKEGSDAPVEYETDSEDDVGVTTNRFSVLGVNMH